MAHYAIININNIVESVFVGMEEDDTTNLPEKYATWEEYYSDTIGATVLRTSYNTVNGQHIEGGDPFRGNYASVNDIYDPEYDVFYEPKPYDNWLLDYSKWLWKPPVDLPDDYETVTYSWDQTNNQWVKVDE